MAQTDRCTALEGVATVSASTGPAVGGFDAISKEYRRRLLRISSRGKAPGVAIAVIEHGRLSWSSASGHTQRRGKRAFDAETVLPLGRLSEIPIALSAVRLARVDQLKLELPITNAPSVLHDSRWPLPTLRQLLSHQGGLNGGRLHDLYIKQAQVLTGPSPIYAIRAPGLLESYSLAGYRLAYDAVEQQLGTDLRASIVADLASLRPPRCAPSLFRYQIGTDDARGHLDKQALDPISASDPRVLGLRGNLHGLIDLIAPLTRLDSAEAGSSHVHGNYLRADFAELVRQTEGGVLDFGRRGGLGFALSRSQRPGVGLVALAFGMPPGYRTEVRVALDHQIATIVVSNGGDEDDLDDLGSDLLDDVLTARKGLPPREDEPPLPDHVALPKGLHPARWAPRYATPIGRLKILEQSEDSFDFEIFGRGFRATLREDGWYQLSYRFLGVIPLRFSLLKQTLLRSARWQEQTLLLAHIYGRTLLIGSAVQIDPQAQRVEPWLGEYHLTNPDLLSELLKVQNVRLGKEDGYPYIEYHIPFFLNLTPRVLLQSLDPNQLMVSGIGPLLGERIQLWRDGEQHGIEYAGYRFERTSD